MALSKQLSNLVVENHVFGNRALGLLTGGKTAVMHQFGLPSVSIFPSDLRGS